MVKSKFFQSSFFIVIVIFLFSYLFLVKNVEVASAASTVLNVQSFGDSGINMIHISGSIPLSGITPYQQVSPSPSFGLVGIIKAPLGTANGKTFSHWSGCFSSLGALCNVTFDPGTVNTITAVYTSSPPTADFSCSGSSPEVEVEWNSEVGATSYTINRNGVPVGGTIFEPNTFYTDTSVSGGVFYKYTIKPNNGPSSQSSDVNTGSCNPPEPVIYDVLTSAGPNCSFNPTLRSVISGNTTTFTVTPDTGYTASASGCGGSLSGTTYTTGAITSACTVTASCNAPDLTAGGVIPTTATAGAATSFSATVTNGGNASTTSSFNNLFQFDHDSNHAGVNSTSVVSAGPVDSGGSAPVSASYTFPDGVTTGYVRVCADNNASWVGTILESNENNNCGSWVNVTVTSTPYPDDEPINHFVSTVNGTPFTPGCSISPTSNSIVDGQVTSFNVTPGPGGNAFVLGCGGTVLSGFTSTTTYYTGVITNACTVLFGCNEGPPLPDDGGGGDEGGDGGGGPELGAGTQNPLGGINAGATTILRGFILNDGDEEVEEPFWNFFQVATAPNGGGSITDLDPIQLLGLSTHDYLSKLSNQPYVYLNQPYVFPSAGSYSFRLCADKSSSLDPGVVEESNEDDNCSEWRQVTVNNSPALGPDLWADYFGPSWAYRGFSTNLFANVNNDGDTSVSTPFSVLFQVQLTPYTGEVTIVDLAPVTLASELFPLIDQTISTSYTFPTNYLSYSVRACADKSSSLDPGVIDESNEDNNCGSWKSVALVDYDYDDLEGVDLIASHWYISPSPTTGGSPTSLAVKIENQGDVNITTPFPSFFQIATNPNGGGSITGLAPVTFPGLEVSYDYEEEEETGEHIIFVQSYTFPANGSYSVRACADKSSSGDSGVIVESVENNNCSTWTNIVVSNSPKPDLVAGNTTPTTTTVGEPTILSSLITNNGTVSTSSSFPNFFQVADAIDGGGSIVDLASTTMSELGIGSSNTTTQSYIFDSVQEYSIRACADKTSSQGSGVINESSENNNCSIDWVTINVVDVGTPIDGGWTDWSNWSECSVLMCGQTGTQVATRTCTNPAPSGGGAGCVGSPVKEQLCSTEACSSAIISADPSTIATGESSTLSWASGASSCEGTNFGTGDAASGSIVITPNVTTTYSIDCDGELDETTVTVRKKPLFIEN